jgi:hypothetical protein
LVRQVIQGYNYIHFNPSNNDECQAQEHQLMSKTRSSNLIFLSAVGLGAAAFTAYWKWVRPWHLHWGAARDEAQRSYPGDQFLPQAKMVATHAITIEAPPQKVWPWLAQIGQGRGGFYSYDWIENMMGLDIHTADKILPEHQNIKIGDIVPLSPDGFGIPVALLEPEKHLVLRGDTRLDPGAIPGLAAGDYFAATWAFYLEPLHGDRTRLIERWKADWSPTLKNAIFMRLFLEPGSFLMERKMLLGIKQRAEASSV